MRFFKQLFKQKIEEPFSSIEGYYDLKEIVKRALVTEDGYNLIFIGPPSSVKTLFLQAIMEISNGEGIYFRRIHQYQSLATENCIVWHSAVVQLRYHFAQALRTSHRSLSSRYCAHRLDPFG
jgi:predicted ATPase with chaperone activity